VEKSASDVVPAPTGEPGRAASAPSVAEFLRREPRALAIAAALLANLLLNVVNIVPFLGPLVELVGDAGFEAIVLVLAASLLRRDGRPLRGMLVLGGLGLLKIALDGLNVLPEIGSLMDLAAELGLDLTQIWFLKELLAGRKAAPPAGNVPRTLERVG
jgi:hypothetical protein